MVVWHSFLPFGLSIAICVFVSWKSVESQLELRNDGSRRGISEGLGDDDDDDEGAAANAAAPSRHRHRRDHHHRPPRTASELRARLHTLSRMAPGPRRLARGRALALAAERALREASPATTEGGAGGEESDGDLVVVESTAAAALRQTLPWLDARLAALASEDARAERCGPCEICAGFDDARATHAWPCGGQRREGGGGEGGGNGGHSCGGGGVGGVGGLLAAIFGNSPSSSSNSSSSCSPASPSSDSHSVYTTSRHRACGRCSAKCGAKCPWCRREEGAPRLAFLELCGGGGGA